MNTFDVYNASAGKLQASFRVCGSSNTAVWIETDGAKPYQRPWLCRGRRSRTLQEVIGQVAMVKTSDASASIQESTLVSRKLPPII